MGDRKCHPGLARFVARSSSCATTKDLIGRQKAYEKCKLQYHYVDEACIAYEQPEVAKELIMMTTAAVV